MNDVHARAIKAASCKVTHPLAFSRYRAPNNPRSLSLSLPLVSFLEIRLSYRKWLNRPLLSATSAGILIQRPRHEWRLCGDSWLDFASWKLLFRGIIREYSANPILARAPVANARPIIAYLTNPFIVRHIREKPSPHFRRNILFQRENRIAILANRIINRGNHFRRREEKIEKKNTIECRTHIFWRMSKQRYLAQFQSQYNVC